MLGGVFCYASALLRCSHFSFRCVLLSSEPLFDGKLKADAIL